MCVILAVMTGTQVSSPVCYRLYDALACTTNRIQIELNLSACHAAHHASATYARVVQQLSTATAALPSDFNVEVNTVSTVRAYYTQPKHLCKHHSSYKLKQRAHAAFKLFVLVQPPPPPTTSMCLRLLAQPAVLTHTWHTLIADSPSKLRLLNAQLDVLHHCLCSLLSTNT